CNVRRRIYATGEEDAERHIGHHALLNSRGETRANASDVIAFSLTLLHIADVGSFGCLTRHGIPIATCIKRTVPAHRHSPAGGHLVNALKHSEWSWRR